MKFKLSYANSRSGPGMHCFYSLIFKQSFQQISILISILVFYFCHKSPFSYFICSLFSPSVIQDGTRMQPNYSILLARELCSPLEKSRLCLLNILGLLYSYPSLSLISLLFLCCYFIIIISFSLQSQNNDWDYLCVQKPSHSFQTNYGI